MFLKEIKVKKNEMFGLDIWVFKSSLIERHRTGGKKGNEATPPPPPKATHPYKCSGKKDMKFKKKII